MANYGVLAEIYDELVASIDYDEWASYMEAIFKKFGVKPVTIADLACGTGNTTIPLARRGYLMCGVDLAPAMLARAREKADALGYTVKWYQQDMRELALDVPQDVILSYHDGINYLTEPGDFEGLCRKVEQNLKPGGLFIFDTVNVNMLSRAGGETTVLEENDRTLIWETAYDRATDIWQINLTCFLRKDSGLYEKFTEVHREKYHSGEEVAVALKKSGLELLACFRQFTLEEAGFNGENPGRRLFYVARKGR